MQIDPTTISRADARPFCGDAFRHVATGYDPLNGEGARRNGGRFNKPDSFPVLYLCETRPCAVAEFHRLGARSAIGARGLLPRTLVRYDVELQLILDLSDKTTLPRLGLEPNDLSMPDWSLTESLGEAAHATGIQAVRSPSATKVGLVLAVFPRLLGAGELVPVKHEVWETIDDVGLPPDMHTED